MSARPSPNTADWALLAALDAWAGPSADRLLGRLGDDWRARLGVHSPADADDARLALRRRHAAESRPDPARIHPTWWVRALQDESPAVRRAVAAHAPAAAAEAVRQGLRLTEADLHADHPPHPEALQRALALWSERLVGGQPDPDDPPVVAALTRLDHRTTLRLASAVGLAKRAYAPPLFGTADEPPQKPLRAKDRERFDHFHHAWEKPDRRHALIARQDRIAHPALPWLGLVTVARLLVAVDPHRTRWTLQHLPYPVAKFLRLKMSLKHPLISSRSLLDWETRTFQMACERLRREGRIPDLFGPDGAAP